MTKQKMKQNNVSPDFPWWGWFIISCACYAISGVMMIIGLSVHPYEDIGGAYYFGIGLASVSGIFILLMIKALITEAHIRSMEIFYGNERSVCGDYNVSKSKKSDKSTQNWSWGE